MKQQIAIQGIKGSFHHQVAQECFGPEVEVLECRTFAELARSLATGRATEAVMAIENSIAGSILPNYALIDEQQLRIVGEHYIPIQMQLMALPGQDLSEIKEVASHPMALLQCKAFFEGQPQLRLVEDTDTAEVAQRISRNKRKGVAALAGKTAAEMYQLEILEMDIHSMKSNTTRFLILSAEKGPTEESGNKASLKLELPHQQGSLAKVLDHINSSQLNLTKIQSLPIIDVPWKYAFFIDVLFSNLPDFEKALLTLEGITEELKVLGIYKNKAE